MSEIQISETNDKGSLSFFDDRHSQRKLYFLHFMLSSLVHLAIGFASFYFTPYGYQSILLTGISPKALTFLSHFDGAHYLNNQYIYLNDFAFLPGFTLLVRGISNYLRYPLLWIFLINLMLTWKSLKYLEQICVNMRMKDNTTKLCILLFIYAPSSVFFHSVYSEPLYCFLTFKFIEKCTQNRQKNRKKSERFQSIILPTLILVLAVMVRSTALFLLPVIGWPIIISLLSNVAKKRYLNAVKIIGKGILVLLFSFAAFFAYLIWAYQSVCHHNTGFKLEMCKNGFFNVYSYVQSKYWNVGFLTYYSVNNLVFILIGIPSVIFTVLFLRRPKLKEFGLHLSLYFLLIITITMTNIQSSTRFLGSHPLFYINAAIFLNGAQSRTQKVIKFCFRFWQLFYFYFGTFLFCLEFPWT